jgi:hypothetical protein
MKVKIQKIWLHDIVITKTSSNNKNFYENFY